MCLLSSACPAGVQSISASACFLWSAIRVKAPDHVSVRQAHQLVLAGVDWSLFMTFVCLSTDFSIQAATCPALLLGWNGRASIR